MAALRESQNRVSTLSKELRNVLLVYNNVTRSDSGRVMKKTKHSWQVKNLNGSSTQCLRFVVYLALKGTLNIRKSSYIIYNIRLRWNSYIFLLIWYFILLCALYMTYSCTSVCTYLFRIYVSVLACCYTHVTGTGVLPNPGRVWIVDASQACGIETLNVIILHASELWSSHPVA